MEEDKIELNKWEEKVWGRTLCDLDNEYYSHHLLHVDEGGFCSFHYHKQRANRFIVEDGWVRVVWAYGWKLEHKDLKDGDVLQIPSLLPHQFQVFASGRMIEEYYPERGGLVKEDDIVRLTVGGKLAGLDIDNIGIYTGEGKLWNTPQS